MRVLLIEDDAAVLAAMVGARTAAMGFNRIADREGLRTATRMELDLPVEIGPVKVVPYVLGEAAYWGEDLSGGDLTRLFGQAGLRSSLPIWRADPGIQSELFNLNGLAHKITLEGEVFVADANRDLSQLPLYDALDDDAIEHFRRRLKFNTFDLPLATAVPLGIGLGRIGNFINAELPGRVADANLPWAMMWPNVDTLPRHPSPIYQALVDGVLLFIVLWLYSRKPRPYLAEALRL